MDYLIYPSVPGEIGEGTRGSIRFSPIAPDHLELILDAWPRDDLLEVAGLPIVTQPLRDALDAAFPGRLDFQEITLRKAEHYDDITTNPALPVLSSIRQAKDLIHFDEHRRALTCSDDFLQVVSKFNHGLMNIVPLPG